MNGDCFGKTKYATKAAAVERIRRQMEDRTRLKHRRPGDRHKKLMPYQCKRCGHWHVGSAIPQHAKGYRQDLMAAEIDRYTRHIERLFIHG